MHLKIIDFPAIFGKASPAPKTMEDSDPQQALKRRALRSKHDKRETSGSSNSKSKRRDGATGGECDGAADRSLAEAAVSTLFHAIVLGYYVFVLFAEVEALKPRPEAARVMGGTTFGGRWKFLTYINLVCVGVFHR